MPRVTADSEETTKRAPRKRAVRRTVAKSDTPKATTTRRPRATTSARSSSTRTATVESAPARKAPTQFSETRSSVNNNQKRLITVGVIMFVTVGAAAWIGFSDAGQIDVNAKLTEQREREARTNMQDVPEGSTTNNSGGEVVPVQAPPAAISGIRPRTDGGGTPPPAPVEEPATSTDESVEEEVVEAAGETSEERSDSPSPDTEASTIEVAE